jgi:predicted enzyme related to lactoylglutathione lyase
MACRITELCLDAADPDRLAAFWCQVLGWTVLERDDAGDVRIGPSGAPAGVPTIAFLHSTEPKPGKLRLHIDVNATDREQPAELDRLRELGAVPADIGQAGDESWHVLADPEGNEFCLLAPRVGPLS